MAVKRRDPLEHQEDRAHAYLEQQEGKDSKRSEKLGLKFGGG